MTGELPAQICTELVLLKQSQRGSNPCLHLERAERIVAARSSRSQGMSFRQVKEPVAETSPGDL
jgi:hypothetical protein